MKVSISSVSEYIRRMLNINGVSVESAATIADAMIYAGRCGVTTHSIRQLPMYLEKIKAKPLKTVCKFAVFNLFLVLDYLATVYVLGLPTFEDTGPVMFVILFIAFNLVFYFYDKMLSRMTWFYHQVFVKKVLGKRSV